jgi:kynurenine formamidase
MTRRLIDLSHTIEDGMITYPGLPAPRISDHLSREASAANYAPGTTFHIARIEMVANTGTYLDAPSHRYADGADLAALPLEKLAALDAVVIRATNRPTVDPEPFQSRDLAGKAVLVNTGWSRHWGSDRYLSGHPYLSRAAAELLRDSGAALVGIDTLNIDDTRDGTRPAHSILLAAGIPIVEHMTALEELPEDGFSFFAVPVKIRGMGTFPVRAFALVGRL